MHAVLGQGDQGGNLFDSSSSFEGEDVPETRAVRTSATISDTGDLLLMCSAAHVTGTSSSSLCMNLLQHSLIRYHRHTHHLCSGFVKLFNTRDVLQASTLKMYLSSRQQKMGLSPGPNTTNYFISRSKAVAKCCSCQVINEVAGRVSAFPYCTPAT